MDFVHISDANLRLRDLVNNDEWCFHRLLTVLPMEVKNYFGNVNPHLEPNSTDTWYWDGSRSGAYSVNDGYAWLYDHHRNEDEEVA